MVSYTLTSVIISCLSTKITGVVDDILMQLAALTYL